MRKSLVWDSPPVGVLMRGVFLRMLQASNRMVETTRDPVGAQERCLQELLTENSDTTYGRRHRFAALDSPRAFQASIPLIGYEDLRGIIDTIADGSDPHALTRDDVMAFSTSSGTTAKPKLIPITKGAVHKETRVKEAYFAHLAREYPDVLNGKWFYLFNRIDIGRTPTGLTYGSNAGYMYLTTPTLAKRRFFAVPYEICLIEDYESRYYTILRHLLDADVRYLICINPFSSLLLARLADEWKDELLRDLRDGGLKRDLELSNEQRAAFERQLPPNRAKARELTLAIERRGRLEPRDYWPNLRVTSSWKTGHSQFFVQRIPEWFGDVPIREIGYGSSEFRTGLVLSGDGSYNIPVPDNYFYEFVPLDDADAYRAGRKRPLLLHEVQEGEKYHLIQSGIHGFYRYEVQDVVGINGRHNDTPTFEFVQKASSYTSIAGEQLYEFQISDAVLATVKTAPELAPSFFVAYSDGSAQRYRLVAEFASPPSDEAREHFSTLLDEELRARNGGYARARAEDRLEPPQLHVLERGQGDAYVQWVSTKALYDMQAKIHRLKPDHDDDFAHFGISLQPA